jgi:two-component system OmpR family response regulator
LREWRSEGRATPVLALTSRDRLQDKLHGFAAGADDYLTKPFEFEELTARVASLLRRRALPVRSVVESDGIRLDRDARRATVAGVEVPLSPKELALLEQFILHAGTAVSRESLADHVWDESFEGRSNVIDVLVSRLRRKLERAGAPGRLRAVPGTGWMMAPLEPR